jgi:hypothetical protein
MGGACSTHGVKRNACRIWWESRKERDQLEDLDVGERILIMYLRNIGWVVWIGLIWFRTGKSRGLL